MDRFGPQGAEPFFAALAHDEYLRRGGKADAREVQVDDFLSPGPGVVQELQECGIPATGRCASLD